MAYAHTKNQPTPIQCIQEWDKLCVLPPFWNVGICAHKQLQISCEPRVEIVAVQITNTVFAFFFLLFFWEQWVYPVVIILTIPI